MGRVVDGRFAGVRVVAAAAGGVVEHVSAAVVGAGGAIGGLLRWGLNEAIPPSDGGFPWATFVENVSGCLLLAVLVVFLLDIWRPSRYLRPFLGVGMLGGYTTFSAYTSDVRALLQAGDVLTAMAYLLGTVVAGLLATWVGLRLTRRVLHVAVSVRADDR